MTAYQASRLHRGDCVRFLDGEHGRVLSVLGEWVKIAWDSEIESEIHVEDFDEVDLVSASDPLAQEKIVASRLLEEAIADE
jgi:hypothetical protein